VFLLKYNNVLLSKSEVKLPNNIIKCGQIQQVFCLLIYRLLFGALLSGPTGSLPLDSAGDIGPHIP